MRINPTTSGPGVSTLEKKKSGRIAQIIGPVLDVTFPPGKMPIFITLWSLKVEILAEKKLMSLVKYSNY